MRINFILPFFSKTPAGGVKIMYEYAKRFSERGHDVTIYHVMKVPFTLNVEISDKNILRRYKWLKITQRLNKKPRWFVLPSMIKCLTIPSIKDKYIENADAIVTTWWASVFEMNHLSVSKGKKINLIQGYENWLGNEDLLHQSYNIPNTINIVIASYLQKVVSSYTSNKIEVIFNSIDSKEFFVKKSIKDRCPMSISMMYSKQDLKGSVFGLQALEILKKKFPQLEVNLFSVRSKPKDLPKWISYYKNPSNLCDIYNSSSIFISTSMQEGWGLTPMEAMSCGCACVATEIEGHSEYMVDYQNCLFIQPKDVFGIVDKVSLLIENEKLRFEIASNGENTAKYYLWSNAISKFENILNDATKIF